MMTRPDLSFTVNKVCQFMQHPNDVDWMIAKWIIRYLKYTINDGLRITRSLSSTLCEYLDSDWVSCMDDHQSTSGLMVFSGSNLIS
jgi:hypothetical protein